MTAPQLSFMTGTTFSEAGMGPPAIVRILCAAKRAKPTGRKRSMELHEQWRPETRERDRTFIPRKMLTGARPDSFGVKPLTRAERRNAALDEWYLAIKGLSRPFPKTRADCPPPQTPCPHARCVHHLYVDVPRGAAVIGKYMFPNEEPHQIWETCSLRVADRVREQGITLSHAEVGKHMNLTPEAINQAERSGLAKLRLLGVQLGRG